MDIYTYIAETNPYQAQAILHNYGYEFDEVETSEDLGSLLQQLVAIEGESAFNEILNSHPDLLLLQEKIMKDKKEAFKNYSGEAKKKKAKSGCGCGCNGCGQKKKSDLDRYFEDRYYNDRYNYDRNFSNFNGSNAVLSPTQLEQSSLKSTKEVNVYILAAAILLATAIIVKK